MGNFKEWMMENLGNGTIKQAVVEAAGERVLLSFMRLGFFDQHAVDYPYSNRYPGARGAMLETLAAF